jgi:hypothetical protein
MNKIINKILLRAKAIALCLGLLGVAGNSRADNVIISNNITGTVTWQSTNEYYLQGSIYVLSNAVLNIEPGTVVRGYSTFDTNAPSTVSALFITRDAKIYANGTAENPIVFTSETDDLNDPNDIPLWSRQLWGGIVIYGNATLNTASTTAGNTNSPKYDVFEGLPDSQVSGQYINRYGGSNDADNSGVLRYVSIRHSSVVLLPNKEINALSLCAVGSGTTIDHVECFAAGDDSVEFFGGAVNTKYMASIFSDDDNFDIDQGYHGKNQFWFALAAPDKKDQGGEWNGEPSGIAVSNAPVGNFEIYNATYIGAGTNSTGNRAFISREYAAPKVFNSIFTEYNIGGNIDTNSNNHFVSGLAKFQNNIFWNFAAAGVPVNYWQNAFAAEALTNAANNNLFVDPQITSISRTNFPAQHLDPRPLAGSPALSSPLTAPNDGFYTPVAYRGAFDSSDLWLAGWTFASQSGMLSTNTVVVPPTAPTVTAAAGSGTLTFSINSQSGYSYLLLSTPVLNPPVWTTNETLPGNGGVLNFTPVVTTNTSEFFRILAQ